MEYGCLCLTDGFSKLQELSAAAPPLDHFHTAAIVL